MCVCSHSDLGTDMPATLEKELDVRRGITWMYFKVFSPKGPGRGSTHCGCTQAKATLLDHSSPLPPFICKTLPVPYRSPHGISELQLASKKQNLKSTATITGQVKQNKTGTLKQPRIRKFPKRTRQCSENDMAYLVHPNLSISLHYQSHWDFVVFIFCLFSRVFCPHFKASCRFKEQQSSENDLSQGAVGLQCNVKQIQLLNFLRARFTLL